MLVKQFTTWKHFQVHHNLGPRTTHEEGSTVNIIPILQMRPPREGNQLILQHPSHNEGGRVEPEPHFPDFRTNLTTYSYRNSCHMKANKSWLILILHSTVAGLQLSLLTPSLSCRQCCGKNKKSWCQIRFVICVSFRRQEEAWACSTQLMMKRDTYWDWCLFKYNSCTLCVCRVCVRIYLYVGVYIAV